MKKALSLALSVMLAVGTFSAGFAATPQVAKENQMKVIQRMEEKGNLEMKWDTEKGVPSFVTGKLSNKPVKNEKDVKAFLKANKDMFKLQSGDFKVKKVTGDRMNMKHYKTQFAVDGIPVAGAEMIVHVDENGNVYAVNGEAQPTVPAKNFKSEVKLSGDEAKAAAVEAIGVELDESIEPTSELNLMEVNGEWKPVYLVNVSFTNPYPAYYFIYVDAKTGEVVEKKNQVRYEGPTTGTGTTVTGDSVSLNTYLSSGNYYLYDTTRTGIVRTYTANNGTSLPGSYMTDTGNTFHSSSQEAGVSAHKYAGMTYDYYLDNHNRDSFDGNGADIISTVHYQSNYNNAFWNGTQMVYGDGDGSTFIPLSGALDVVAHEITHAVITNSANLKYENQSGALNESFADVFGVIVENGDWLLGEDVYTPGTPGDALRSISDPTAYNQPAHMDNYYNSPNTQAGDWGGVHTNSGIPNKAFYHVGTDLGFAKTGDIYYRALTVYLTSTSDFADARAALVQSASDLYGATEVAAVEDAFDAVGITDGSTGGGSGSDTYEPNDTMSEAKGSLANGTTYQSYIYDGTDVDWFYVTKSNTSNLNISLTNLAGDYDLYLYNSSGTQLDYSYNGGTTSESISYYAGSGTYYVKIVGYNGAYSTSTPYNLTATY